MAGKLSFAHSPAMCGRLTNTLAATNDGDDPDTDTHSWSPTDVNPPSSHTAVTASPVTRSLTSVDVLVASGQPSSDGAMLGVAVGITVGMAVGLSVGTVEGTDDVELLGA